MLVGVSAENLQEQTDILNGLLTKRENNRKNIPAEELKTRYRVAYQKLLAEIKMQAIVFASMQIREFTVIDIDDSAGLTLIQSVNDYLVANQDTIYNLAIKGGPSEILKFVSEEKEKFMDNYMSTYVQYASYRLSA